MKGLVIKDLICMKKQLILFLYTIIVVAVVAVMFVLSAKFGNVAMANAEMLKENDMTELDIQSMMVWALMIMMLIPIAAIGDFTNLFKEDNKAGFSVVSASLPLSIKQRLFAKYLTVLVLFVIGLVVDLSISFVLSLLTHLVSFRQFCGMILSMASIMVMLGSMTIVYMFFLGKGKEEYAMILSFVSLIAFAVVFNFSKVKLIFSGNAPDTMTRNFANYFVDKSYMFVIFAGISMIISYSISLAIANRKRGVI